MNSAILKEKQTQICSSVLCYFDFVCQNKLNGNEDTCHFLTVMELNGTVNQYVVWLHTSTTPEKSDSLDRWENLDRGYFDIFLNWALVLCNFDVFSKNIQFY